MLLTIKYAEKETIVKEKPKRVSQDQYLKEFGVEAQEAIEIVMPVSPEAEPDKIVVAKQTGAALIANCVICEANAVRSALKKNFLIPEIADLFKKYEEITAALTRFYKAIIKKTGFRFGYQDYRDFYELIDSSRNYLSRLSVEETGLKSTKKLISDVKKELLSSGLMDKTKFYPKPQNDGSHGNFCTVEIKPEHLFFKIPLLLGLKTGFHILAACDEHLFELKNFRLATRLEKDRLDPKRERKVLNWLGNYSLENAEKKLVEMQIRSMEQQAERSKYLQADLNPRLIDLKREMAIPMTEHYWFGIGIFGLPENLNTFKEVITYLKTLTPKQISELEILMISNYSYDQELERAGQKAKGSGKYAGDGWPGGGVESAPWSRFLEKIVTDPYLAYLCKTTVILKKSRKVSKEVAFPESHAFCHNATSHLNREFENETGYSLKKIFGRVYRQPRGPNNVFHASLVSPESEPTKNVKETLETKKVFKTTFLDLFKKPVGGLDTQTKEDREGTAYKTHMKAAYAFFKNNDLPMFEEVINFGKRI